MEKLTRSLRALARADTLIATIWLTVAAKRGALLALAALIAALGFGMLNAAGYFALEPHIGPIWAAVVGRRRGFPDRRDSVGRGLLSCGRGAISIWRSNSGTTLSSRSPPSPPIPWISRRQALLGPLMGIVSRQLRSFVGRAPKETKEK